MNEDEKICPYCGGVIKKVAIKCKHCKALLNKEAKKPVKSNKLPLKPSIKLTGTIALSILLVLGVAFGFHYKTFASSSVNPTSNSNGNGGSNYSSVESYKSISPCEYNSDNRIVSSRKAILDTLIQQESDLKEYMNTDNSIDDKSMLFSVFLNNITCYGAKFDKFNDTEDYDKTITSYNSLLSNGRSANVGGVVVKLNEQDMQIISPNAPFVKMLYTGEGYFDIGIDYKYLYNTYSDYLAPAWKDYLSLKRITDEAYIKDGYVTVSMSELTKWIMAWEGFLKKYPKFPWYNKIDKLVEKYVYDFLSHESADEQIGDGHDWKKDYEVLLQFVNPQGKSYKTVKRADELKNNSKALHDYIEQVRIQGGFAPRH